MPKLNYDPINTYVLTDVLRPFYKKRIEALTELKLITGNKAILSRKNPYLFKAKNILTAEEFVRSALDAHLSSQEETYFGNLMEGLAVFVCGLAFKGQKPEAGKWRSLDLVFARDDKLYIVGIKSGPHWANSDQIAKMRGSFKAARQLLRTEGETREIIAINGCMYGKENAFKPDASDSEQSYYKLCGQAFWELISGDADLYLEVIKPIDDEAKKRDEEFKELYTKRVNGMVKEFSATFINQDEEIDWEKLLELVSKQSSNPLAD